MLPHSPQSEQRLFLQTLSLDRLAREATPRIFPQKTHSAMQGDQPLAPGSFTWRGGGELGAPRACRGSQSPVLPLALLLPFLQLAVIFPLISPLHGAQRQAEVAGGGAAEVEPPCQALLGILHAAVAVQAQQGAVTAAALHLEPGGQDVCAGQEGALQPAGQRHLLALPGRDVGVGFLHLQLVLWGKSASRKRC